MFFNNFLAIVNSYDRTLIVGLMQSNGISLLDCINFMVDMQYLSS
jgi:hypothetical protein